MIDLPDESAETFVLFRRWLYAPDRKLSKDPRSFDWMALGYLPLCELWKFGERRIIPSLQNRVMDLIISKMSQSYPMAAASVQSAYTETSKGSLLRKIVCFFYSLGRPDPMTRSEDCFETTWFQEFAVDVQVLRFTTPAMKDSEKRDWDRCVYHVHEQGVKCTEKGWKPY